MKTVSVSLRVKPGRSKEFARGVARMVEALERVDGTLAFLVSRSDDDPHAFRFFEIYRDEPAFREHLRIAASDLPGREAMDELVEGPYDARFGELVAGGRWLEAPEVKAR